MPAITADTLTLPRLPELPEAATAWRKVHKVVRAAKFLEGEGFQVRRPFPSLDLAMADPFLLLDHMGAVEYGPGEAKGAPWHPHRGFETVTYMIDGAMQHTDSIGGGGLITDGSTQWMTAGQGILHNEVPPQDLVAAGGLFHGVQLWVNLPRALKLVQPRYQDIAATSASLIASDDGGALVRIIAGELDGHAGPGSTYSPITYLHATVSPGARLAMPWPRDFNALVYVLSGEGTVGPESRPLAEGHLAVLTAGEALTLQAAPTPTPWEILILGGRPINEPVARYGPFVMNTRQELSQAFDDYQAGRLGQIPATHLSPADDQS
ncbi:pirin family protein [Actinokineospora pegani]|uniref:pirin family protein n=1 Tax=Actinokineospora pegani TaxID=2654637 RepID=UPI0012EA9DAE|nr:pirin family protein [Actinokineospora pegani]